MGRALIFADPQIIELAQTRFIPVVGDDWYQRRRQDAAGEFLRKVADQGPRKRPQGDTQTRQGIYCFTAAGELLAYRHGSKASHVRAGLKEALERFESLPEESRQPVIDRAPEIVRRELDPRYVRRLPEGGVIVRVRTRALDRTDEGEFQACRENPSGKPYGIAAARDILWLRPSEWQALIPRSPQAGDSNPVPKAISERLCRFHLVDNTRGEPPMWEPRQIRRNEMTVSVERVEAERVRLRLDGRVLLTTNADPDRADRGYEAELLGWVEYDPRTGQPTRFDVVALGETWGAGRYTPGARPGRTPLGIAFQLASGDEPGDRIPPQGIRSPDVYWGR